MDTRESILRCADALFREKGYNGVSMRDVAAAAGIRVGNLTYYFPRKEQLVEALFSSDPKNMLTPEALTSREEFERYFRHLLAVQRRAAFYFDSYVQLSQTSDYIARIQRERLETLRSLFTRGLETLSAAGEIAPARYEGDLALRAETLLTVLMLRLPGQERQFSPPEADEAVLRRAMALLGEPPEPAQGHQTD